MLRSGRIALAPSLPVYTLPSAVPRASIDLENAKVASLELSALPPGWPGTSGLPAAQDPEACTSRIPRASGRTAAGGSHRPRTRRTQRQSKAPRLRRRCRGPCYEGQAAALCAQRRGFIVVLEVLQWIMSQRLTAPWPMIRAASLKFPSPFIAAPLYTCAER